MADAPLHMWPYYREETASREQALDTFYPDLVKSDPVLSACRAQMHILKAAIDGRMEELVNAATSFDS